MRDAPGFTRTPLAKMGWWASDTAQLHFDATRALLEDVAWRLDHEARGTPEVVAAVCMAKNTATHTMQFCTDAAV